MTLKGHIIRFLSGIRYFYSSRKRKEARKRWNGRQNLAEFRKRGIRIGCGSFLDASVSIRDRRSTVGKYCSIARNVTIGTGRHPLDTLTTNAMVHRDEYDEEGLFGILPENRVKFEPHQPVSIGNDVWIGLGAVIMDGVTIGDGAVIGASAVVTKDIPPYAIAAGIPAKVIRNRFDAKTVDRLLAARWWDRDREFIRTLPMGDVQKCLEILEQTQK